MAQNLSSWLLQLGNAGAARNAAAACAERRAADARAQALVRRFTQTSVPAQPRRVTTTQTA